MKEHIIRWLEWRKTDTNNLFYKFLVLIKVRKCPSFTLFISKNLTDGIIIKTLEDEIRKNYFELTNEKIVDDVSEQVNNIKDDPVEEMIKEIQVKPIYTPRRKKKRNKRRLRNNKMKTFKNIKDVENK